ncbi:MAG: ABC transporter ATP-binding protein [Clostridia bacterium]
MIQISHVSKSYVKGKKSIDNINLEVRNGEIFGFLGPNGAGKTTTIKMITGILNPDEGDIFIDGRSIKSEPIEAKKRFGFVPDTPDMFLRLKGIEYLNFLADIYEISNEERKERIKKLTQKFEIHDVLQNQIQTYSHGMRQKIVICGVLLNNPKDWILDEPMVGLDPKSSYDLKEMMREHAKQGNTVFFSTHVLEVAEKLCDRFAIIDKGQILFVGTYEEMKEKFKEKASLEELFLEITEKNENEENK